MHDRKYIYESPDNGKTVYKREFGDYHNRKLIKPKKEKQLTPVLSILTKLTEELEEDNE